ncbi:tyrosine recombinase XerC [Clostridium senegalense]|uniref:Tyrosine recombinase XerC n=1 Tax=Clostridium senegalense TaxID=1465809 RepID=A0A6M0H3G7_9CLOT|nr:tyrosine recombinase XerC [Clostridium senegalense]NEU04172.1 tyrosine recombinase XerC [Clostridium senegalense]
MAKLNCKKPYYIDDFLNYMTTVKGVSKSTLKAYTSDINLFLRFLKLHKNLVPLDTYFDNIPINDISIELLKTLTLNDFYAYVSYLENSRGNGPSAKARKVASLKSLFNYLVNKVKLIPYNVTLELESPKLGKRSPIYLTLDESKDLLTAAKTRDKNSQRDYCIITLFLNCGLRLSELCSINISNIKGDILKVLGKGNKERTIYLNKAALKSINNYMPIRNEINFRVKNEDKDALFISGKYGRINKRTVERIVKKYVGLAGLDKDKYTPHKLRHTSATLMHKYGKVDVRTLQQILGHENVATTQIYTHVDNDTLREAINQNPLMDE